MRLEQAGVRDAYTNEGPVSLLFLAADHRIARRLVLSGELDGRAVPGGRAIDLSVRLAYAMTCKVDLLLGARALDGFAGADGGGGDTGIRNSIRYYYYTTAGLGFRF